MCGCLLKIKYGEQERGGVGGHRIHLSPRVHRNTPSDTEMHAEHQLRADRST